MKNETKPNWFVPKIRRNKKRTLVKKLRALTVSRSVQTKSRISFGHGCIFPCSSLEKTLIIQKVVIALACN